MLEFADKKPPIESLRRLRERTPLFGAIERVKVVRRPEGDEYRRKPGVRHELPCHILAGQRIRGVEENLRLILLQSRGLDLDRQFLLKRRHQASRRGVVIAHVTDKHIVEVSGNNSHAGSGSGVSGDTAASGAAAKT